MWPTFDPETQETRIQVDAAPSGRALTLHEAAKLSDVLRQVRAALLGLEDGKGDDQQTRAITEAYRLGYEAGREDAAPVGTCDERGATGPVKQREVNEDGHPRTVRECVDSGACFGRLEERRQGEQ